MRVTVNGEEREIASSRVDALLSELEYEGTHFAIALNYDVLPKSRWAETVLKSGDEIEIIGLRLAVELDGAAGGGDPRMQLRQHAPRLDMAFVRVEQAVAEAAFQRRLEFTQSPCIEPPMAGGAPGKPLEVAAVARMRHDQRAVHRSFREMPTPEIERADAEPADHGLGSLGLAPGREHAAGPVTGGLPHRGVAALMHGHGMAGLRQQQRVPGAGDACADDGNGGIPTRS